MTEIEIITEQEEKPQRDPFEGLDSDQYLRYCIFEEYAQAEFDGPTFGAMVRTMDAIFRWIKDGKPPRTPKDTSHLEVVKGKED